MLQEKQTRKFDLGQVVITLNARDALAYDDVAKALDRHITGDWGDVCPEDWESNQEALQTEERLFSVYHDQNNTKLWIITEADRSATTILLPEDY